MYTNALVLGFDRVGHHSDSRTEVIVRFRK